jgi:hypothetical protein
LWVSTKSASDAPPPRELLRLLASVAVSGLSQITWMPRRRKARADRRVHVVRRDDRHRLDPVFSRASRLAISAKSP